MDRRRFVVRSARALATVGLGGSSVAKKLESRHGEQASVNPGAREPEMATREEMFVRYSDSIETLQAGESETVDQITATLFQPVNRTSCSASILGPRIETLGIWPLAIATSSQRYSRGQFWQSL